jgi:ELWxxDGT repeat protein
LWFVDAQDANGMELSFVGPAGSVIQLGDLNPGLASSMSGGTPFARVDDRLFFIPQSVDYGAELWVSDGTIAGTLIASDIRPGIQPSTPGNLVGFEGRA